MVLVSRRRAGQEEQALRGAHNGVYRSATYCYNDDELVGDNINFSKTQPVSDSERDDSGHLHTARNSDTNMSLTPV